MLVHEVKDGKITKSYVQGSSPMEGGSSSRVRTVLMLNVVVAIVAIGYIYFKGRRRRKGPVGSVNHSDPG